MAIREESVEVDMKDRQRRGRKKCCRKRLYKDADIQDHKLEPKICAHF